LKGGIVVIGELNVDAVATGLPAPPRMGAEVLASDVRLTLGSASAIFACGAAKLGHRVTFVSRAGQDDFGDFCLDALRRAGVSTRRVGRVASERTGVTLALSMRRDRALVTFPGAMATYAYEHVDLGALEGARHLHMTSYFLQTALRPAFPRIFREAHGRGLTISFDPNSDPSRRWGRGIRRVLAHTDVLLLNRREAIELTGARDAGAALRSLGGDVPVVVVKHGPRGAAAVKDGVLSHAPGFRVDALDTTGAGDSFAAGFVSAWLDGKEMGDCLRAGNACGALSTRRAGGTDGQPDAAELRLFLRRHPATTVRSDRGRTHVASRRSKN
jgi:sugar/nucleoside kinase (ribokinase family)